MPGRFFLAGGVAAQDEPPRLDISPGDEIHVLTTEGPQSMRWGLIPTGRVNARGRPVMETIINARSETVFDKTAFAGVRRAVVPASGWYEWTGQVRRKQRWRIMRADGGLIYFAAIYDVWQGPGGISVPQVATITCPPSAEIREIHHRMGVILEEAQIPQWLNGDNQTARALLVPFRDGGLSVEKANDLDVGRPIP